jgi:Tol biopolymer transport system component
LKVGTKDCPPLAADVDLAPWVTPDGKTLLFSHTRVDANCQAVNQGKDLYTTLLQPATGQPPAMTAALPMNDVNSAADDVQPSFSGDLCDLYFASNREGPMAVYRAHRR